MAEAYDGLCGYWVSKKGEAMRLRSCFRRWRGTEQDEDQSAHFRYLCLFESPLARYGTLYKFVFLDQLGGIEI